MIYNDGCKETKNISSITQCPIAMKQVQIIAAGFDDLTLWGECARHDLRSDGLKEAWAQDKTKWKSVIGGNCPTRASMEKGRKTMMMMMKPGG